MRLGEYTVANENEVQEPKRLWDLNADLHSKIEAAHDFLVGLGAGKEAPKQDDNTDENKDV